MTTFREKWMTETGFRIYVIQVSLQVLRIASFLLIAVRYTAFKCINFNPSPNKPWFLCVCSRNVLKTLWEKEKLLVLSNFSFFHSVFYRSKNFLSFSLNFKLSSANSFILEGHKICRLGKGLKVLLDSTSMITRNHETAIMKTSQYDDNNAIIRW